MQSNKNFTLKIELEFNSGSRHGEIQELTGDGTYEIGCDDSCAVNFVKGTEPFVSRHHAELSIFEGQVHLCDLNSSNGTYINGNLIEASQRLYCGDMIELGVDGPRVRILSADKGMIRPKSKHGTIVMPKPKHISDLGAHLHPVEERVDKESGDRKVVLLLLLVSLIAVLIYQTLQTKEQKTEMQSLRSGLQNIEKMQQKDNAEDIALTLNKKYGPAVFLVGLRVKREGFQTSAGKYPVGHIQAGGTAWAFDKDGLLATNAHVISATIETQKLYPRYLEFVVIQNGTGKVFKVISSRIHPDGRDPAKTIFRVGDVGIIFVDKPVPAAIPLQSKAGLEKLSSGMTLYSIGFPVERSSSAAMKDFYSYDSPDKVLATLRQGIVQRVTTADGRNTTPAEHKLIHLSIATTGGQSGSPIFSKEGEVAAILTSSARYHAGKRALSLPHPGMFSYAVRIDVLKEMLKKKD
ncbi:MAG: FHA domain-containing protein [Planctomycetota bacterium]|jgi:hypothetical protein